MNKILKSAKQIKQLPALTFTKQAEDQIRKISQKNNQMVLALDIKQKGCQGNAYSMYFIKPEEIHKLDRVVRVGDKTLVVKGKALLSLIGTKVDFKEDAVSKKTDIDLP